MLVIKNLLYLALLALPALASPVAAPPKTVYAYKCKNGGTVKLADITENLKTAPLVDGKSSYPHAFTNAQNFPMDERCKNKNLLEMPALKSGKQYNFDSKPKDDPGPIRTIYSNPGKLFCNVIAHVGPGNTGNFEECEPLLA